MAHFHRARLLDELGRAEEAEAARALARQAPDLLRFPAGLDDHDSLVAAVVADLGDTQVKGLLGMLLFDAQRPMETLVLWRAAIDFGPVTTVTLRNAAVATYAADGDIGRALALYDAALETAADARLVYESDQLHARAGASTAVRLGRLESHRELLLQRDDATTEYCSLHIDAGRLDDAAAILHTRRFAPWEGGEGRVLAVWEDLHLAFAGRYEVAGDLISALVSVQKAIDVPTHLGEARHDLADTTRIYGRLAELLDKLDRPQEADSARRRIQTSAAPDPVRADGTIDYFATSPCQTLSCSHRRTSRTRYLDGPGSRSAMRPEGRAICISLSWRWRWRWPGTTSARAIGSA